MDFCPLASGNRTAGLWTQKGLQKVPHPPANRDSSAPPQPHPSRHSCSCLSKQVRSPSQDALLTAHPEPPAHTQPSARTAQGPHRARGGLSAAPPTGQGLHSAAQQMEVEFPHELAGGQSPDRAGGPVRAGRTSRGSGRAWAPRVGTRQRARCPRPRKGWSAGSGSPGYRGQL